MQSDGQGSFWLGTPKSPVLADFRGRVVRTVLCEYRMDIQTGKKEKVRDSLGSRQAPCAYVIAFAKAAADQLGTHFYGEREGQAGGCGGRVRGSSDVWVEQTTACQAGCGPV